MVVILGEDQYDAWLKAPLARSMDFIKPYAAGLLSTR